MSQHTRSWIGLALLIGALLGGAYLIVAHNNPALSTAGAAAPAGVFH